MNHPDLLFLQGRITCDQSARFCPGIAIGCGLCAILSPDTCSAICPISAVYCGTAGYVCKDPEEEPETTTATTTTVAPPRTGEGIRPRSAVRPILGEELEPEGGAEQEVADMMRGILAKPRVEDIAFEEFYQ